METGRALAQAGLHPATGGDGSLLCSGDMLLQALVACAGVTLQAVATALAIPLRSGRVRAEGDLDFRGTLGVDREAPVGFSGIRLSFELDADADEDRLAKLCELTERYCVVYQTLAGGASVSTTLSSGDQPGIAIRLYLAAMPPPHVHAVWAGEEAVSGIAKRRASGEMARETGTRRTDRAAFRFCG